jgi:hypothetical protein
VKPPPEEKPIKVRRTPGLSKLSPLIQVGEVVVELAQIGDIAVGRAAAAVAAQADGVDRGARRLQRLGQLQHRGVRAAGAVHQHDRPIGWAGIDAVVQRCAVTGLDGLDIR